MRERTLALAGEGDGLRRRYRHEIDLAALGIALGDDVIARLSVRDNRVPEPNRTQSASFILRWPPEAAGEASGVEGLVQRTMPAYFRSQRQIIIDTEALLAERPRPDDDAFLARSDGIGVDQRVLRLRYGQFLGEEDESLHADEGRAQGERRRARRRAAGGIRRRPATRWPSSATPTTSPRPRPCSIRRRARRSRPRSRRCGRPSCTCARARRARRCRTSTARWN